MAEAKQIEVACPCCEARLAIDVRTAKVVRWQRPEETDESGRPKVTEADWDAAHGRAAGRIDRAGDRFDDALGREQARERDLDDRFDRARRKAKGGDEPQD